MGYIKQIACLSLTLWFFSCAAELKSWDNAAESDGNGLMGRAIEGTINLAGGGTFDLKEDVNNKTLLLIFAQDTCSKCSREAREIAQRITEIGRLPTNVEIITYLTGTTPEHASNDAKAWIAEHSVTWKVGFEKDGYDLFGKYFPSNRIVPSVLIQKDGQIIFTHRGQSGQEKMEEITGVWE